MALTRKQQKAMFAKGDLVEIKSSGEPKGFAGKITQLNPDGSVRIKDDVGGAIAISNIKHLKKAKQRMFTIEGKKIKALSKSNANEIFIGKHL